MCSMDEQNLPYITNNLLLPSKFFKNSLKTFQILELYLEKTNLAVDNTTYLETWKTGDNADNVAALIRFLDDSQILPLLLFAYVFSGYLPVHVYFSNLLKALTKLPTGKSPINNL